MGEKREEDERCIDILTSKLLDPHFDRSISSLSYHRDRNEENEENEGDIEMS